MLDYVQSHADEYRHWPENVAIWLPGGDVPTPGERLVQADLGRTLQFLCDEESAAGGDRMAGLAAVRSAFYRGDIARQIIAHQRENDGLLAADDLASFRCQVVPSVSRGFRFGGEAVEIHTAARGARARSCWKRCRSPRRQAWASRIRLGRVPAQGCRNPQAHVRGPGRLSRRSGLRGRASRYADRRHLRGGAEQGHRPPQGLPRHAASRPYFGSRGLPAAGRLVRCAAEAAARHVHRLRHRRRR